jgi:hypothetical protein
MSNFKSSISVVAILVPLALTACNDGTPECNSSDVEQRLSAVNFTPGEQTIQEAVLENVPESVLQNPSFPGSPTKTQIQNKYVANVVYDLSQMMNLVKITYSGERTTSYTQSTGIRECTAVQTYSFNEDDALSIMSVNDGTVTPTTFSWTYTNDGNGGYVETSVAGDTVSSTLTDDQIASMKKNALNSFEGGYPGSAGALSASYQLNYEVQRNSDGSLYVAWYPKQYLPSP